MTHHLGKRRPRCPLATGLLRTRTGGAAAISDRPARGLLTVRLVAVSGSAGQRDSWLTEPATRRPCETPGATLAGLSAELSARGIVTVGMTITRWNGTLMLVNGPSVEYRSGWLWWPVGRVSRYGRPVHACHPADDPAGAAHRLAPLPDG